VKTYHVGVIACGGISHAHAQGYARVPRTKIVAGADINPEQHKRFGEAFGVERFYTDYREMLEKESLDIVSVTTYPTIRKEATLAAVAAGARGIYCEKPMCMDLAEAEEMVSACRDAGAVLIVGHQRRFEGPYVKARELAHSGAIGDIRRIENACPKWDLFEWGTHWMDMMLFLNNDVGATWVLAQIDRRWDRIGYGHRMETEAFVSIGFENGVRGIFESGDRLGDEGFYNRIYGTEGMIELHVPGRPALRARVLGDAEWGTPPCPGGNPFQAAIEALIESMETGKPHTMGGDKALKGFELMMAAYESARTGKLVELPLATKTSPLGAMLQRVGVPLIVDPSRGR
jgi:predicted dehydrogenase